MTLENETTATGLISKAFQAISKETSFEGLAQAVLKAGRGCSGAAGGAMPPSEKRKLLANGATFTFTFPLCQLAPVSGSN